MSLRLTPSPPDLTPQLLARLAPKFNQEHLNSPSIGLASPLKPNTMQMPLREVWDPVNYDYHGKIQGVRQTFIYQPFYHHRRPKLEAPYSLLHGKASGSD
jgi:hypothetical protein